VGPLLARAGAEMHPPGSPPVVYRLDDFPPYAKEQTRAANATRTSHELCAASRDLVRRSRAERARQPPVSRPAS
jgi:hypothetical protein